MGDELSASALQLRARAAGSQLHARPRPARVRRAGRVGATTGPRLTRSRCPPHLWGVGVQRRNVLPIYGEVACSAGMSSPFMVSWRAAPECPPHLWGVGVQRRNVLPIYGEVARSAGGAEENHAFAVASDARRPLSPASTPPRLATPRPRATPR